MFAINFKTKSVYFIGMHTHKRKITQINWKYLLHTSISSISDGEKLEFTAKINISSNKVFLVELNSGFLYTYKQPQHHSHSLKINYNITN